MATPLGWGVIGCGDVVVKKSGPSILQADRSRVVAVMRRDVAKARPFAIAHGISFCTDDAAAVIQHPEVDIVYVATPPSTHKEYVLTAAAAGKHVLVEKPMGLSVAEDREMIEACERAGVELFVAYYRRFHPHVVAMKELIDAGRIGRPVLAQIDYAQPPIAGFDWGWRVKPEMSGGGLFVDVVTHRIDAIIHLLGEPATARGVRVSPGDAEEVVTLAVKFGSGALGSVTGDFVSGRKADRFVIIGTDGVIHAERLDGHRFTLKEGGDTEDFAFDPLPAPHLGLIRHIERVLAGSESNASSGHDGAWTDLILDHALRERTG